LGKLARKPKIKDNRIQVLDEENKRLKEAMCRDCSGDDCSACDLNAEFQLKKWEIRK